MKSENAEAKSDNSGEQQLKSYTKEDKDWQQNSETLGRVKSVVE